jgi:hypothetical protein
MAKRARDPVQFTRESAERIANVVRSHELASPSASPLTFDKLLDSVGRSKTIRRATFTGSWPVGSVNAITFYNSGGQTAYATNLSWPIRLSYGNLPCIVGYDRGTWYLLVPELEEASAVVITNAQTRTYASVLQTVTIPTDLVQMDVAAGVTQKTFAIEFANVTAVQDVTLSATLNTNDCTIAIGKTLATTSIKAVTSTATGYFATATDSIYAATQTMTARVVTGTASAAFVTGTAVRNYLRIRGAV